ncbi:MAG: hypothetical protein ACI4GZ_02490 [Ruminococcus sp.]
MSKKVSLPLVIAISLVAAAIAFSLGYVVATSSANKKLTDLSEKQALFTTLADVDSYVREKYEGKIDKKELSDKLLEAYAEAFGGQVIYLSAEEYRGSEYTAQNGYTVLPLADGSAVVVLNSAQYEPTSAGSE